MTDLTVTNSTELTNLSNEAMQDAGFQRMLKFKKGDYWCDGEEVPRGTQMVAHCIGWTKTWVHFHERKVIERKVYRVIKGERPPQREDLPDQDQSQWSLGLDGKPADPWVLQYLLPMEDPESGEVRIFVTSSAGGRIAVGDLCSKYAAQAKRDPNTGQPLVRLQKGLMKTASFGDVPRPHFEIVGWSQSAGAVREIEPTSLKDEMEDEIPF